MLIHMGRGCFRWETWDPEADWSMVGHLFRETHGPNHLVLIDPPMTRTLVEEIRALGTPSAIILTTVDHTRGARYLYGLFQCDLFVPAYGSRAPLAEARLPRATPYRAGDRLPGGLTAAHVAVSTRMWSDTDAPYLDEALLIDAHGGIFTGDIAMGSPAGHLYACPEGLNTPADPVKAQQSVAVFANAVPRGSHTLWASHGQDIVAGLASALLDAQARLTAEPPSATP